MGSVNDSTADKYLRRKKKNLEFFKVNLPRIYQILENMMLTRAELVVTPGKPDVDLVIDGKSCYRGLAEEYSRDEALEFLKNNPPEVPLVTYSPEWPDNYPVNRFGSRSLKSILDQSSLTRDTFEGYWRGNIFPSIVFLGCGLGFHIEEVLKRANVINACIVEREPEKFALSLFTVDWAGICSRFKKKGYSISFAIGLATSEKGLRDLLSGHLQNSVPIYPYFTKYYNHLADVELARVALDVSKDIAHIATNWSHYDDQLIRFRNTKFNVERGMAVLKKKAVASEATPAVIVGSGPSIDKRIESLRAMRERIFLVSAGTGLRPLLKAGIRPDVHLELDPSYLIYEIHADYADEDLSKIALLAVNEINPHVPELFGDTFYYFKSDNAVSGLLGVREGAFEKCNPTCTNAAVSIVHTLGFRQIYMFGTDYGFESVAKDHSDTSIYGEQAQSAYAKGFQEKAARRKLSVFSVDRVGGGKIYTRNDYYTAKCTVENLIVDLKSVDSGTRIFNCSDGAEISGTDWLSQADFEEAMSAQEVLNIRGGDWLADACELLDPFQLAKEVPAVVEAMELETSRLSKIVDRARLEGRKDITMLANELKSMVSNLVPHSKGGQISNKQVMALQLIQGTVLRLVLAGLAHALGSKEDKDVRRFLKNWRQGFLEIMGALPDHLSDVMNDTRPISENPWAVTHNLLEEPEMWEREEVLQ